MQNKRSWHLWYGDFYSDFCDIAKYWNSDRIDVLAENVVHAIRLKNFKNSEIGNTGMRTFGEKMIIHKKKLLGKHQI